MQLFLEMDRYLEVRLNGVNKGECLINIVNSMGTAGRGYPDFALCIGNDDHDEYMYSALHALDGTGITHETDGWYSCLNEPGKVPRLLPDFKGFSCIVGQKARYLMSNYMLRCSIHIPFSLLLLDAIVTTLMACSTARYYVDSVEETWELLEVLDKTSAQSRFAQSMGKSARACI